jgi:hypothetical protein
VLESIDFVHECLLSRTNVVDLTAEVVNSFTNSPIRLLIGVKTTALLIYSYMSPQGHLALAGIIVKISLTPLSLHICQATVTSLDIAEHR